MHCLPEIQSELASGDFVCFLAWGLFACLLLPSWPVSLPSDPAPAGRLPQTPLPPKAEPCRSLHGGDRLTPRYSTSGPSAPISADAHLAGIMLLCCQSLSRSLVQPDLLLWGGRGRGDDRRLCCGAGVGGGLCSFL